jgi:hypothetical protein
VIESTRRVALTWDRGQAVTIADIASWAARARTWGCPDATPVRVTSGPDGGLDVQWDATDADTRTPAAAAPEPVVHLIDGRSPDDITGCCRVPIHEVGGAFTTITDLITCPGQCVAHGLLACPCCSLNDGPTCGGCGIYEHTGMHWDTCPHRLRDAPGLREALAADKATRAARKTTPRPRDISDRITAASLGGPGSLGPVVIADFTAYTGASAEPTEELRDQPDQQPTLLATLQEDLQRPAITLHRQDGSPVPYAGVRHEGSDLVFDGVGMSGARPEDTSSLDPLTQQDEHIATGGTPNPVPGPAPLEAFAPFPHPQSVVSARDLQALRDALAHLPAVCRYHGEQVERVGAPGRPCCDTGAPAVARRRAETALGRIHAATSALRGD